MKKLTMSIVAVTTIVSATFAGTNLITNGDFSNGTTGWEIFDQQTWYTGDAKTNFYIQNGEAVIIPVSLGQYEWESYIYQSGISLVQGKTYECSFDVRLANLNDGYRPISFEVKGDWNKVGNVGYYGVYSFPIADNYTHTFRFTMVNPTDNNAVVSVTYGQNTKGIILDNFVLKEVQEGFLPTIDLYAVPYQIKSKRPIFGWIGRDDSGIKEYQYSIDGTTEITTTATSLVVPYDLTTGSHTFSVWPISNTGERGYGATAVFTVEDDGTTPISPKSQTKAVPTTINVNDNGLNITTSANTPLELSITNAQGRVLYSNTVTPSNNTISLSRSSMGIATGVYMLQIKDVAQNAAPISSKISF